jgi:hypothetical protein
MFLATTLLYPCALVALCVGAGLLIDRACGSFLPAALLVSVGAAGLIALSQLSTYVSPLAASTPYLMSAVAVSGFVLAPRRACGLLRRTREQPWPALASVLAYAFALAPVLAGGRPSFSSYMALADSAVHMMGADFLITHGQDYAHLDLHNSYGQFIHDYYGIGYPSGADTLFGGSAFVLGLPLIWAFQPFNAFMLAAAAAPAWLIARRMRLAGAWAGLAALSAVLPALVYAYGLLASVKEITALAMLLTLGALIATHRDWLRAERARVIPFAIVLGAGVSALGPAFGAWALAAVLVLACVLIKGGLERTAVASVLAGAAALLLAALPTWLRLPAALRVASVIATTSNSGNLRTPLRVEQVFGVWLYGSYKLAPAGAALTATHAVIAVALLAAALGAAYLLVRVRAYALCGWLALMLLASLAVGESVTAWGEAKTLVLSSSIVVLLAWAGVSALRALALGRLSLALAGLLALTLAGATLASDAYQYHSSDLAPTQRYDELASLNARFAGRGPTLFTDFDEYAMYELRDLDIGGPDFVYAPPALAGLADGYGQPVDLERVSPRALLAYPLILTRRDPSIARPPAAYRLLWQGSYYQVWGRRAGAAAASVHAALAGSPARECARIRSVAVRAAQAGEDLVAAPAPLLIRVPILRARRPSRWGREREGLVMGSAGTLAASFELPSSGAWDVWVQGQIMPAVALSVDGRRLATIAGQLDGNSLVPDTVPPIRVHLTSGRHRLTLTRAGFDLGPGDGGMAVLDAIFLTPANVDPRGPLRVLAPARWHSLCGGGRYRWIEAVGAAGT